jgi:hypothetical protein
MYIRKSAARAARRLGAMALAALACAAHAQPAPGPGAEGANVSAAVTPEGGRIVVEAHGVPPPAPLFFSAEAVDTVRLGMAEVDGEMHLKLHVIQGRPDVLTLGLSGEGDIVEVTGAGLRDWSVRQDAGAAGDRRLLDLHPLLAPGAGEPRDLDLVVRTRMTRTAVPGTVAVLIATPGEAVGFSSWLRLEAEPEVDFRVTSVTGLSSLGETGGLGEPARYFSTAGLEAGARGGGGDAFLYGSEQTDVRVGAGLLRQTSRVTLRVLQGKIPGVRLLLDGPGEILGVEGANVVGWKVLPEGQRRVLDVRLSRPIEGEGTLVVRSQAALGSFPVRAEPLRLTPEGAVRHSGYVRVANDGAVRLEVAGATGMMQLAPSQFPGIRWMRTGCGRCSSIGLRRRTMTTGWWRIRSCRRSMCRRSRLTRSRRRTG